MKEKLCLILEGGGAKCAYQSGVLKVLEKAGYKFDAIGGASFGAVNGAMFIAGKSAKVEKFWNELTPSQMFKEEKLDEIMDKLYCGENIFDKQTISFILNQWKNTSTKYEEVSKMYHDLIKGCIDEDLIRKSKIDFGFVSVELPKLSKILIKSALSVLNPIEAVIRNLVSNNDNKFMEALEMKPAIFYKHTVPNGRLADYIDASSAIPAFKPVKIDDKIYTDGGLYDNNPVNIMANLGYKNFLVVRVNNYEPKIKWQDGLNIKVISPTENLGSCAMFSKANLVYLQGLGLKDAVKFVDSEKRSLIWKIKRKKLLK